MDLSDTLLQIYGPLMHFALYFLERLLVKAMQLVSRTRQKWFAEPARVRVMAQAS